MSLKTYGGIPLESLKRYLDMESPQDPNAVLISKDILRDMINELEKKE